MGEPVATEGSPTLVIPPAHLCLPVLAVRPGRQVQAGRRPGSSHQRRLRGIPEARPSCLAAEANAPEPESRFTSASSWGSSE